MKPYRLAASKRVVLIAAALLTSWVFAQETIKVPIKVNVAEGVECSDDVIKDIVKEANKDFKEAGSSIELELDSANISRGVKVGDPNGHISNDALGGLNTSGQAEADKAFGDGKGIKAYIGTTLQGNPNTYGLGYHRKDKDGNLVSPRVIYLKNRPSDPNSSRGNDMGHEVCHTLTLGRGHRIDPNTVADGGAHHPTDPNNWMYPYNPYHDPKEPNVPLDRGNGLTPDQIKEIERTARSLGRARTVTTPDANDVKAESGIQQMIAPIEEPVVRTFSKMPMEDPIFPPYVQLGYGRFMLEWPYHHLDIDILFHGLFPEGMPGFHDIFVMFYLDVDNNPATGMFAEGMPGVDKIIHCRLDFMPHFATKGRVWINLHSPDGTDWMELTPGVVSTISMLPDSAWPEVSESVDFVDGMKIRIPTGLLGPTAAQIPMRITTMDPSTGSFDFMPFVLNTQPEPWPRLISLTTLLMPRQPLVLEGAHFTPNGPVAIEIDGETVFDVIANGDGTLFVALMLPPTLSFGEHEIMVRDLATTRFDFFGFKVAPNRADLNADGRVNLQDFAVFAENWLEIRL